jgi:hypothetical protein
MSLDSSWQALCNSGFIAIFGGCDFGSPKSDFHIFVILFHIKSQKLISPVYDTCFGCCLHYYSRGEGGYHPRRF